MLNEQQIREALLQRLKAVNGSCNETHLVHNEGVVRGLLWALTGEDHGTRLLENVKHVLDLAGIKNKLSADGQQVEYEYESDGHS